MQETPIIKILLVEDSPTDARLLQHELHELPGQEFEITWVECIKDAIDRLHDLPFNVVLLDLSLPDSVGVVSISRIQQAATGMPIVVLTGLADEIAGSEAIRRGVQEFLVKGTVDGKTISRAIRYAIMRKRAEEDMRLLNTELQSVNKSLSDSRLAALNLMDDAIAARDELARREEQLQERANQLTIANKELESFSYSVSHDLRAPIRAIRGFCDILLEDYANNLDAQAQNFLTRIIHGTDKMSGLIDDMLGLAKISLQEMKPHYIALDTLALSTVNELRQTEPTRMVTVVIQPDLHAFGDQRLLAIALSNLIGNAWKYTSKTPNAKIEVGIRREADGEKIYIVRDNGAGFDMTHVKKLFVPFQRLHSETQFPGTGIGLAIVSKIIQRHGGRVWGEASPGNGATFYFTLSIDKKSTMAVPGDS